MPVVKNGQFLGDDWSRLEEPGGDITSVTGEKLIVPLPRLLADGETLAASNLPLGVDAPNTVDVALLEPFLDRLGLIAVSFPGFADGRGFTVAQRLRRLGFKGVLRASGHIIPDQYAFALACGFDEVEITLAQASRQPEAHWREALDAITARYQQGYKGVNSIFAARQSA